MASRRSLVAPATSPPGGPYPAPEQDQAGRPAIVLVFGEEPIEQISGLCPPLQRAEFFAQAV